MGRSYKLCKSCDNMQVFREHRYHVSSCITAFPVIACGTYFFNRCRFSLFPEKVNGVERCMKYLSKNKKQ